MIDNIFIKDENDYINYSKLKPRYKYNRKKVKFVCTKCNCISEKTFVCLSFPFVCTKCIKNSEETKEKRKQTNLKKFGTEFASQSNICKEHLKETCIKKYGTINPFQIDEVKDKIKETNKKRYGVENPFQSEEIKEKIKHTVQDRYGSEYITQTDFFKEKSKQTCLEKYGVPNYTKTDEFKEKFKQTCLEKYGVENASQVESVKEKIKQTCLEKYGVENSSQSDIIKEKIKNTNNIRYGGNSPACSRETIQKMKNTMKERYGVENAILNHNIFIKTRQKYYYDGRYFDSSWELAYYIWLKDNNADFEYQPAIKFKYTYNDETHYYCPDFKIGDKLQEIKGNLFFENGNINEKMICPFNRQLDGLFEAKHQCMIANNVRILTENDIKEYIQYVKSNYGINFLKNCKVQKT